MSLCHVAALVFCASQAAGGGAGDSGEPGWARRLGLRLIIMIVLASAGLIAGAMALLVRSRRRHRQ